MKTRAAVPGGCWCRILDVDLTTSCVREEDVDPSLLRLVVGGSGLGAYYLFKNTDTEDASLDPGNPLVFATGPLQATQLPGSAKWTVASRSPLGNHYGESAAGAGWGIQLKRSGYDALVIRGASPEPVYLLIQDGRTEIRPAAHLWGEKTSRTRAAIAQEIPRPKASIAVIGPGGENLVRFADIMVDGHSAAGRTGMGAVMGSKRLKAIVVSGSEFPELGDPSEISVLRREWVIQIKERTQRLNTIGTPGFMPTSESLGNIPTKNWQLGVWPEGTCKLGPEEYKKILVSPVACPYCPVACHRAVKVTTPDKYSMEGPGPEYETLGLLGQNCLIDSLPAVCKLNELCNELGLDTISAGSCIAFAMECFERGYLGAEDNDGSFLRWGDADGAIDLLENIASRRSLGAALAEGTVHAAREIGEETTRFAVAVKGVDLPAHNPRAFWAHALNYATGSRGACHERGNLTMPYLGLTIPELGVNDKQEQFTMSGVPHLTARAQDWSSLWNSLVICRFMGYTFSQMVEAMNEATGWDMEIEEAVTVSERLFNLQRLVNLKFGVTKEDDVLPRRIYEPVEEGPLAGRQIPDLEPTLQEYYEYRGWDRAGVPKAETLRRLQLVDL